MPTGLKRYQTEGHDHLITFSCYHRLPYLNDPAAKQHFEQTLETARARHGFQNHAYVVMPEHVHLLVSESEHLRLATALDALNPRDRHAWHDVPMQPSAEDRTRRNTYAVLIALCLGALAMALINGFSRGHWFRFGILAISVIGLSMVGLFLKENRKLKG